MTRRNNPINFYVMAKLALHVPDHLVAAAKREAASRKTSVSKPVFTRAAIPVYAPAQFIEALENENAEQESA